MPCLLSTPDAPNNTTLIQFHHRGVFTQRQRVSGHQSRTIFEQRFARESLGESRVPSCQQRCVQQWTFEEWIFFESLVFVILYFSHFFCSYFSNCVNQHFFQCIEQSYNYQISLFIYYLFFVLHISVFFLLWSQRILN